MERNFCLPQRTCAVLRKNQDAPSDRRQLQPEAREVLALQPVGPQVCGSHGSIQMSQFPITVVPEKYIALGIEFLHDPDAIDDRQQR